MMKDRWSNLWKWIYGAGMFCLILVFPEIWIAKLITRNNPESHLAYAMIMGVATTFIYLIIVLVKVVQYFTWEKQYEQETLDETKKTLNSDFKTVLLNSPSAIPKEMFQCEAKVDDGKIICKIHLDMETKWDSYEEFQKYFHFTKE